MVTNEVVAMGEVTLVNKLPDDKAPLGIPADDGPTETTVEKAGDDIIPVKTTEPAEEV